jgi:hypothetical protein
MPAKRTVTTLVIFVGVVVGIAEIVGLAQRGSSNSSVIGVWRVSEETTTGPNGQRNTNPQPSVRIFTQRYLLTKLEGKDTFWRPQRRIRMDRSRIRPPRNLPA